MPSTSWGRGDREFRRNLALSCVLLPALRKYSCLIFPLLKIRLLFVNRAILLKVQRTESKVCVCLGGGVGSSFFPVSKYMWILWALLRLLEVGILHAGLPYHHLEQPQACVAFSCILSKCGCIQKQPRTLIVFFFLTLLTVAKTEGEKKIDMRTRSSCTKPSFPLHRKSRHANSRCHPIARFSQSVVKTAPITSKSTDHCHRSTAWGESKSRCVLVHPE